MYTFNSGSLIPLRGENFVDSVQRPASFSVSHVNGYTFRLEPTKHFSGLQPGATEKLRLVGGGWAVSRSEVRSFSLFTHLRIIQQETYVN